VQSRRRASPDAMYIPRQFDVADPAWNHALIRAHSFSVRIMADDIAEDSCQTA
jgi:predicted FMN-binding regulatory protein PaiB